MLLGEGEKWWCTLRRLGTDGESRRSVKETVPELASTDKSCACNKCNAVSKPNVMQDTTMHTHLDVTQCDHICSYTLINDRAQLVYSINLHCSQVASRCIRGIVSQSDDKLVHAAT